MEGDGGMELPDYLFRLIIHLQLTDYKVNEQQLKNKTAASFASLCNIIRRSNPSQILL